MTQPGPYAPDDTPTAADFNAIIARAWNPAGPYIRVKRTTDQVSITSGATNHLATWQDASEKSASGITWSAGTPTIVTINEAALFWIGLHLIFTANTSGHRWGFVTKNSTDPATGSILYADGSGVGGGIAKGFTLERLAANDVLRVYGNQDSGSTLSFSAAFGGSKLVVARWAA